MKHRPLVVHRMFARVYIRNPIPFGCFLPDELSPEARDVLLLAYRLELQALGDPGPWLRARITVVWGGVMALSCLRHFWRHRALIRRELPAVRDRTHLARLFACAFRHNIPPFEFYRYKFYQDRFYPHRRAYLLRWQLDPLLVRSIPAGAAWMADKLQFWQAARDAGLPVVEVWGALSSGRWTEGSFEAVATRGVDLVIKPARSARGEGILFADHAGGDKWSLAGRKLSTEELRQELCAYSKTHDLIIQPRVGNHPDFARYGSEGLATLRIVTMKTREMAEPECLVAALRLPHGAGRLANLHKNALVCSIDLASGRLSRASGLAPACEDLATHPASGAPHAGETVPHWAECLRICRAGHLLAPELNSVGWDVIIDASGPRLLEANLRWGSHVLQISGGTPLWRTRFAELYREAS